MSIFAFDWHHRAEGKARDRGRVACPARHDPNKWRREQLTLHDRLSEQLVSLLPLTSLLVAGSCAKGSYRKTLSSRARHVEVLVSPGVVVQFELDFLQNLRLRRITVYIQHPSAAFFSPNPNTSVCIGLDASLNFALWLNGQECQETHFTAVHEQGVIRAVPRAAPLAELQFYLKLEREAAQRLGSEQYSHSLLPSAEQYLGQKLPGITVEGMSFAEAVRGKLNANMKLRHAEPDFNARHRANNRKRNAVRFVITYSRNWHGREVRIRSNGRVPFFIDKDRPALILVATKSAYKRVQESVHVPIILFSNHGLSLRSETK
jgi:hypothetical protein